jgi:hypothetical protein
MKMRRYTQNMINFQKNIDLIKEALNNPAIEVFKERRILKRVSKAINLDKVDESISKLKTD